MSPYILFEILSFEIHMTQTYMYIDVRLKFLGTVNHSTILYSAELIFFLPNQKMIVESPMLIRPIL